MEFEAIFYKDSADKSPIDEFFEELAESNKVLLARTLIGDC